MTLAVVEKGTSVFASWSCHWAKSFQILTLYLHRQSRLDIEVIASDKHSVCTTRTPSPKVHEEEKAVETETLAADSKGSSSVYVGRPHR